MVHQLTFGPLGYAQPGQASHVISGKEAEVVNMACPECGATLFIYYRHVPPKGEDHERTTETGTDSGADHSPQSAQRAQQQKEGDEK